MLKLLSIFIFSVALMQVSATEKNPEISTQEVSSLDLSEPRIIILAEMTKKILGLKLDAAKSAWKEASNINGNKKQVASLIKVALDNVRDQLNSLDKDVRNATIEARKSKKCIASCIWQKKRSVWLKVRPTRILKCKKSFSFDILKLKIAKLAAIKVKAVSIIPTCVVLHPLNNTNLKDCIQKGIDDSYASINLIKSEIDEDAAKIQDKASECVENNLGSLDLDIEDISDNFNKCVQNKLKEN